MEMSKIKIVFMPAKMASILQPMGQGVNYEFQVLLFKKCNCKDIAVTDGDSDISGLSKSKPSERILHSRCH